MRFFPPAFIFFIIGATSLELAAQCGAAYKVLHYTETTGYDHNTRNQSLGMFQAWENADNFVVTSDNNGDEFNTLSNLQQYAVVVFSNTSGDNGLTSVQRANFESYISGGGSYLGIHAASDTYRHSTANGGSKGTWDWYAETVAGATVQQNPNHTSQNHNNTMTHEVVGHPTLTNVPSPWNKTEEYYYWENGYLNSSFTELLRVGSTGSNSQDAARMMAHCKNLSGGGRAFYTALGHSGNNYTGDQNFQQLIRNALDWVAEPNKTTGGSGGFDLTIQVQEEISCYGGSGRIKANPTNGTAPYTYAWGNGSTMRVLSGIPAGTYTVQVTDSLGCVEHASVTLTEPDELTIVGTTRPSNDPTAPNGAITPIISGGQNPFSFSWTGPNGFTASTRKINGLEPGVYTLTVTDANGCQNVYTTTVDNTTSVEAYLGLAELTIAPNPAVGRVVVSGYSSVSRSAQLKIYTLQGQVMYQDQMNISGNFSKSVSTEVLAAGVYLLSVVVPEGSVNRKLMIQ